ncbi:MAG: hypothetical protein KC587_16240 [Nitrospira sp.]|nr:hypothetical protein [Nitrospira sp.]
MTSSSQQYKVNLPIDWEMVRLFLRLLMDEGHSFCWQILPDKPGRGFPKILFGDLETVRDELIKAQLQGCGIFLTVNRTNGRGRKRKNILAATAVFVDGDNLPLPKHWPLEPHILVQRDENHWHAYWLIEPSTDFELWTQIQKQLAQRLGTDPTVSDLPRVMRVPGFLHQKKEPVLVVLVHAADPEASNFRRYTLQELQDAFQLKSTESKPPRRKSRAAKREPQHSPGLLDLPEDIKEATRYLKTKAPIAVEGEHGDATTIQVAARLKDLGVSQESALTLMRKHWNDRCEPSWTDADLAEKVKNAFTYLHENLPGCDSSARTGLTEDEDELTAVLDSWVWAVDAKCFVRRSDCAMWDRDQFESNFSYLVQGRSLWNRIIKGKTAIRRFEGLAYRPGEPEFLDDGRYNIWRSSGMTPQPGDVETFLRHMQYLIPDQKERDFVLDYLAYLVQFPGQKIHFALVLQGIQGTGKSFLGQLMEDIIGEGNTNRPSNEELHSPWTTWQRQAQLVIVEELMSYGRQELINKLKPVITDETIQIQEKYRNTYTLDNCLNFLMFTNYKDALKIERNDRRFFVVFSPARPNSKEYYIDLFKFLRGDGPAYVAHWLGQRDLSSFHPKGVAPLTAAKLEMRQAAMDEVHQVLSELVDNSAHPFQFDLVEMNGVERSLPDRLKKVRNLNGKLTDFLKEQLQAVKLTQIPVDQGRRKANLWAWKKQEMWETLSKAEIGRQYDAWLNKNDELS